MSFQGLLLRLTISPGGRKKVEVDMTVPKYWILVRNKVTGEEFSLFALQCSEPGVDPVDIRFNSVDFFDSAREKPGDYEILKKKRVGVWPPPELV